MENVKERYGIEPMTFAEEIELAKKHSAQARTRNNKRRMVIALENIAFLANNYIEYVKEIPEEDNETHASKVAELTELFESISTQIPIGFEKIVYV